MDRRVIFVLVALVLGIGGYLWWSGSFEGEETAQNDTVGGQTPQETMSLFVNALKANDPEMASQFFALDESIERERWQVAFEALKERGSLTAMARDIERAKPNSTVDPATGYAEFILEDSAGEILATIVLVRNSYTGVWKIKSI